MVEMRRYLETGFWDVCTQSSTFLRTLDFCSRIHSFWNTVIFRKDPFFILKWLWTKSINHKALYNITSWSIISILKRQGLPMWFTYWIVNVFLRKEAWRVVRCFLLNSSSTYRRTQEVFPTQPSPRRTTLKQVYRCFS